MSGPYYGNNSPENYRHDMRDRPRRDWDPRDGSRGRLVHPEMHEYGRLREDDFTPDGTRRRSPVPMPRRRPPRSRSPPNIDRYTPGGGPGGPPPGRYNTGDVYIPGGHPPPYNGPPPMSRSDSGNVDRYVPANVAGGHGGPGGGGYPPSGANNAMAPILLDPHSLDYLVPFTYFSEWYSGTPPNAPSKTKYTSDMTMKERYDIYKEGLAGRVAKLFVKAHKEEEWFRERYMEGEGDDWRSKMLDWRRGQWKIWADELKTGRWDNWLADAKEGVKLNIGGQSNGKVESSSSDHKDESMEDASEDVLPAVSSGTGALRDDSLDRPALLIKTVSPTVKRTNLEKLAMTVQGFQYLSLGDPNPNKKFHRIGWILIDPSSVSEGTLEQAALLLNEERIHDEEKGDFVVHVGVHNPPKVLTRKMLHDIMSVPEEIISEVDRVRAVVLKLEEGLNISEDELMVDENGEISGYRGWDRILEKVDEIMTRRMAEKAANEPEEEPEDGEAEDDLPSDEELERAKRTIDIAVEYLRRVFSFCYYCFTEADSIHELVRRCPGGHIRRPLPPSTDGTTKQLHPGSEKWVKNLRDRIQLFLNPDSVDLKKLGAQDLELAVAEETNKFIKQEDEGKFRCRVKDCAKLFKSEEFVRKHMSKRHPEFVQGIEQEIKLLNAYVTDPFHITAPKPENSSMGQGGGHGGMGPGGLPPRPGGPMDPRNAMSPFGAYPPGQYPDPYGAALGPTPAGVDRYIPGMGGRPLSPGRGGPGPMRRRGGGMVGNGRPSPYARPGQRDPRDRQEREREREGRFQAAMAAGGGTPVGNTPSAGATPGKDDPGAAGRSLKSYMDLDASDGKEGKVEELDY